MTLDEWFDQIRLAMSTAGPPPEMRALIDRAVDECSVGASSVTSSCWAHVLHGPRRGDGEGHRPVFSPALPGDPLFGTAVVESLAALTDCIVRRLDGMERVR